MSTANKNALVQPYLFYEGHCEEAIELYKKALGAEVVLLMRIKDSPEPPPGGVTPENANKILHATLRVGQNMFFMSDGRCTGKANFDGFFLSLSVFTPADADKYFNNLADGGQVRMPLTKTFFSPRFGMVADRFGVGWMVIIPDPHQDK